jgi:hypothetical protein
MNILACNAMRDFANFRIIGRQAVDQSWIGRPGCEVLSAISFDFTFLCKAAVPGAKDLPVLQPSRIVDHLTVQLYLVARWLRCKSVNPYAGLRRIQRKNIGMLELTGAAFYAS